MISQIATATTEQASTAEQITSNVEQIAKITQESAASAQQSAKACEKLSNLTLDLQQLVSRFKLHTRDPAANSSAKPRGMPSSRPLPAALSATGKSNGHGALAGYGIAEMPSIQ
jgi:methyl-accepting chemotaxis protein